MYTSILFGVPTLVSALTTYFIFGRNATQDESGGNPRALQSTQGSLATSESSGFKGLPLRNTSIPSPLPSQNPSYRIPPRPSSQERGNSNSNSFTQEQPNSRKRSAPSQDLSPSTNSFKRQKTDTNNNSPTQGQPHQNTNGFNTNTSQSSQQNVSFEGGEGVIQPEGSSDNEMGAAESKSSPFVNSLSPRSPRPHSPAFQDAIDIDARPRNFVYTFPRIRDIPKECHKNIARQLQETYKYLVNPIADGNCGIMSLLAVLVLRSQGNQHNTVRGRILRAIQTAEACCHDTGFVLPTYACPAFNNKTQIKAGLQYLRQLFGRDYRTYITLKNDLNNDPQLYDNVSLALRYLIYAMFIMEPSFNNTISSDIELDMVSDLIRNRKGTQDIPKCDIDIKLLLLTLERFGVHRVPHYCLSRNNRARELQLEQTSNLNTLDSIACIFLNGDHFQILAKVNPDQPPTQALGIRTVMQASTPWAPTPPKESPRPERRRSSGTSNTNDNSKASEPNERQGAKRKIDFVNLADDESSSEGELPLENNRKQRKTS